MLLCHTLHTWTLQLHPTPRLQSLSGWKFWRLGSLPDRFHKAHGKHSTLCGWYANLRPLLWFPLFESSSLLSSLCSLTERLRLDPLVADEDAVAFKESCDCHVPMGSPKGTMMILVIRGRSSPSSCSTTKDKMSTCPISAAKKRRSRY